MTDKCSINFTESDSPVGYRLYTTLSQGGFGCEAMDNNHDGVAEATEVLSFVQREYDSFKHEIIEGIITGVQSNNPPLLPGKNPSPEQVLKTFFKKVSPYGYLQLEKVLIFSKRAGIPLQEYYHVLSNRFGKTYKNESELLSLSTTINLNDALLQMSFFAILRGGVISMV